MCWRLRCRAIHTLGRRQLLLLLLRLAVLQQPLLQHQQHLRPAQQLEVHLTASRCTMP